MKRKFFLILLLISTFFVGSMLNGVIDIEAASKRQLEEIVFEQQKVIENLQADLKKTNEKLTALENKENNAEEISQRLDTLENAVGDWKKRMETEESITDVIPDLYDRIGTAERGINLLKTLHTLDEESINEYIKNLKNLFYGNLLDYIVTPEQCQYIECTPNSVIKDVTLYAGNSFYNIFDYTTEDYLKNSVLDAVEEAEVNYNVDFTGKITVNVSISRTETKIIEVMLND
jgi:hypothetical protein